MKGSLHMVMRHAPAMLVAVALLIYLTDVVTILAEGQQLSALSEETMPTVVKLRAIVLTFIKPLEAPMFPFLGGALLWRFDLWLNSSSGRASR